MPLYENVCLPPAKEVGQAHHGARAHSNDRRPRDTLNQFGHQPQPAFAARSLLNAIREPPRFRCILAPDQNQYFNVMRPFLILKMLRHRSRVQGILCVCPESGARIDVGGANH